LSREPILPRFTKEIPIAIEEEPAYGYETPWATYLLIAANVAVYLVTSSSSFFMQSSEAWISRLGFIPLGLLSDPAHLYRVFTAMFTHAGILHILFNMYFLYLFGRAVERSMGHWRYLLHYFLSGLVAAIVHTVFMFLLAPSGLSIPSIGASGAISGVLGAYLILYPGTRLAACMFFFIIPFCFELSAAIWILFWFMLQVLEGFYLAASSAVAFFAHAGGFVAGIALLPVLIDRRRLALLRSLASARRLFGFIVFIPVYYLRRGLSLVTKTLLLVLVSALLLGALTAYVYTPSSFTTMTYRVHWVGDGTENAYLGIINWNHILTAGDTIDSKVLLDILASSGLLFSTEHRGATIPRVLVGPEKMILSLGPRYTISISYVLLVKNAYYTSKGVLEKALVDTQVMTPHGPGSLKAELALQGIYNGLTILELMNLVSLAAILGSMIVVAYKDEELVITPE